MKEEGKGGRDFLGGGCGEKACLRVGSEMVIWIRGYVVFYTHSRYQVHF